MRFDLESRTAIVTGAGRGNGKAIAEKLVENGANVIINDLDEEVAENAAQELQDIGGQTAAIAADVSDESAVEKMVAEATDDFGTIDILVNNAGVGNADAFMNKPDNTFWDLNIDTHLRGAIHCSKHVLDSMTEQNYGKIINITSIHTKNGVGMSPQYDVGKFSLLGLTKSLALELGQEGIRVNAVAPGWVDTRMTDDFTEETTNQILDLNPLGRFAQPEDIANAALFLASPASDYVNGHEFRVDGGQVPIDNFKHQSGSLE